MMWQKHQLDNTALRVTEDVKLWQTERGIIEISKNTLALSIKLDDQQRGYVFHGHGKLLLDTLVETDEGAIGKPVEKEIREPFLMLGDSEEVRQNIATVKKEYLEGMGYASEQEFVTRARELFDHFFGDGRTCKSQCFQKNRGHIFAFLNEVDKLDILVAEDSKLVYKAMDMVFVSSRSKSVLKSPDKVIVSHKGKLLIIKE